MMDWLTIEVPVVRWHGLLFAVLWAVQAVVFVRAALYWRRRTELMERFVRRNCPEWARHVQERWGDDDEAQEDDTAGG